MAVIIPFPTILRPVPVSAPVVAPALPAPTKRTRGANKQEEQRLNMLAKVHIALDGKKGQPGLFDTLEGFTRDVYEFTLLSRWGVESSGAMNNQQLHELLLYLQGLGFTPRKGRNRKHAPEALHNDISGMSRTARMEKIEAMLAEKGRVEGTDVPWGYAVGILKRQTAKAPGGPVVNFDKASPAQLDDVIAALYRDAKRKGRRVR